MFHLKNDIGEETTVGQKIFLSTLGLTTYKTIQTVLSKSEGSRTISNVAEKKEAKKFREIKYQIIFQEK